MQLQKQTAFPVSLTEAINMGKVFFESGLFSDLKSAAQAVVKIQAGAEIGIPPFAALTGIHIIQGKPSIGAGLMSGRVKASGKYNYEVVQLDDKLCSLDFFENGKRVGNSSFSAEDAKKADTKNMGKHPKNMLFARAMSNGVKWFCPDVFSGPVYTPEDFGNVTEDTEAEVIFTATEEQWNEANELIKNSTLDDNARKLANDELSAAANFPRWQTIITRLRQLQTA